MGLHPFRSILAMLGPEQAGSAGLRGLSVPAPGTPQATTIHTAKP